MLRQFVSLGEGSKRFQSLVLPLVKEIDPLYIYNDLLYPL